MTDKDLKELAALEKESLEMPENVRSAVADTLEALPEREAAVVPIETARRRRWKFPATIAAACLALFLILPNTAYPVAGALSQLPVIGTVFKAVTFRDYAEETANTDLSVQTPKIDAEGKGKPAAAAAGKEIDQMNEAAVAQFKKEHADGGYGSLNIYYDVVCDNDRWYTVRVTEEEAGADTMVVQDYYTFDKATGDVVILSDLFEKDEYIDHISENIKQQMRTQMKQDESVSYFLDTDMPEEDFRAIDPNQDFYFDGKGRLVICFDEMEVAPASMGSVSFTVPSSVYAADLAPEYK